MQVQSIVPLLFLLICVNRLPTHKLKEMEKNYTRVQCPAILHNQKCSDRFIIYFTT